MEKFDTEDQVELSFEINSDRLTDDPKNQESLAGIRKKLNLILNEPGAMLKEFHVIGKASPEGYYQQTYSWPRNVCNGFSRRLSGYSPMRWPNACIKTRRRKWLHGTRWPNCWKRTA